MSTSHISTSRISLLCYIHPLGTGPITLPSAIQYPTQFTTLITHNSIPSPLFPLLNKSHIHYLLPLLPPPNKSDILHELSPIILHELRLILSLNRLLALPNSMRANALIPLLSHYLFHYPILTISLPSHNSTTIELRLIIKCFRTNTKSYF